MKNYQAISRLTFVVVVVVVQIEKPRREKGRGENREIGFGGKSVTTQAKMER